MFEIAIQFMVQLVSLMPAVFGVYVLFDLMGSLLFGKRQSMEIWDIFLFIFSMICVFCVGSIFCLSFDLKSLSERVNVLEDVYKEEEDDE